MKRFLAVIAMAASFSAHAFFPADRSEAVVKAVASFACSLQVNYNTPDFHLLTINYVGGSACWPGFETAIQAAKRAAKAAPVYGEPAWLPPPAQCSINVNFDPATASQPDVVKTGIGCAATVAPVLALVRQAVACNIHPVPCTLPQ